MSETKGKKQVYKASQPRFCTLLHYHHHHCHPSTEQFYPLNHCDSHNKGKQHGNNKTYKCIFSRIVFCAMQKIIKDSKKERVKNIYKKEASFPSLTVLTRVINHCVCTTTDAPSLYCFLREERAKWPLYSNSFSSPSFIPVLQFSLFFPIFLARTIHSLL